MSLRVREFPERGVLVWFAVVAGIVAWLVHLTLFAALVEFVHHHGFFWLFYVGNAVAILITGAGPYSLAYLLRSPAPARSRAPQA